MSRGQQGIGISAAGMYGQLTTGKPVQIISRTSARTPAHYFEVQIDTKKNEPQILEKKQIAWESQRGTQVTRSEEHTSELQSRLHLVCRLLLEKKKTNKSHNTSHRAHVFSMENH